MRELRLAVILLFMALSAKATLVADYRFNHTLNDSLGTAPALVATGSSSFASETVGGVPRTVLQFPAGTGLRLSPTSPLVSSTTWSVAMLFRLHDLYTADSYIRLLDTSNHASDNGLYTQSAGPSATTALLTYYLSGSNLGATPITKDQYVTVVFTRNAAGQVTGYVNGVQQFQLADAGSAAITASTLYFFLDETNENGSGAVSRIQLYDTTLSPGEVSALNLAITPDIPALNPALLAALALILAAIAVLRVRA